MLWTCEIKSVIVQVQHINNKKLIPLQVNDDTYTVNKTQLSV